MSAGANNWRPSRTRKKPESFGYPNETEAAQLGASRTFSNPNRTRNQAKQEQLDLERAMEESLQDLPPPVTAAEGNLASGISFQNTSVDDDVFTSTNHAPVSATTSLFSTMAALGEVQQGAEATAAPSQPKTKRKQPGPSPPGKRRRIDKVAVQSEMAKTQPVTTAAGRTRRTRQTVRGQAKTFAGTFARKEEDYFLKAQTNDHLSKLPPANLRYVSVTRTTAPKLLRHYNDHPYYWGVEHEQHPKVKDARERGFYTGTMGIFHYRTPHNLDCSRAGIPLDKRQDMKASHMEGPGKPEANVRKTQTTEGQEQGTVAPAGRKYGTRSAARSALAPSSVTPPLTPKTLCGQEAFMEEANKAIMTPEAPPGRESFIEEAMKAMTPKAPPAPSGVCKQVVELTPYLSFGHIPAIMKFRGSHTKHTLSEQEEAFYARPSIKIIIPDMLKGLLVDDWENVTKNNQLVPIPHPKPVTKVMDDYLAYEKPRRTEGSAAIDILEETVAGLKEYFDKCLGRVLLYRFERAQYAEMREKWTSGGPEVQGKTPCESYGAEHLMRLITSLPELIAQTNMDQQSVNRLREELSKFCQWLERNANAYFVNEYESPNAEYAEKAKN
ncbi:hypothetical protein PG987_012188 [Apiospora arundinis]